MVKYLTPYEWKQYNILVLPSGFPYGGMENPCLTFVTPGLISGDRSLASVIAHELSHSWSGNLVTNKDWSNFWLNEGMTVFLERKIIEIKYGKQMMLLSAQIGYTNLLADINRIGEDNTNTSLHPEIGKVNYYLYRLIPMIHLVMCRMKKVLTFFTSYKVY
jgi:leukotriene-A4 hydrolase